MKLEIEERTYAKELHKKAVEKPNETYIHFKDVSLTYKEVEDLVITAAAELQKRGVKPGDHVAIWSVNSIFWIIRYMAVIRIGAVAVLMNYGLDTADTVALMSMSDCKFLIYGATKAIIKDKNSLFEVADGCGIKHENLISAEIKYDEKLASEFADYEDDSKRTALIIFTTGTTSMPKAVMLSQYNVLNNATCVSTDTFWYEHQKLLIALPLFHSFGMVMFNTSLLYDVELYLEAALKPDIVLSNIINNKITVISTVCTILNGVLMLPDFSSEKVSTIRLCVLGGGFSSPIQIYKLEEAFKNAVCLNGFGQTESSPVISIPSISDSIEVRATTIGHPVPDIELKIVDDKLNELPSGAVGEIVLKGYSVTNGYYKLPKDKQPFDDDGWLHTGDLGYINENGNIVLSGRIKDIIIRAGENIAPSDVESVIYGFDNVQEAKVFGAINDRLGESVECCIVPKNAESFDADKLTLFLRDKLAHFKIPEHFFLYDNFPKLENGKLNVRRLKSSMLEKLKKFNIEASLDSGRTILKMQIKNSSYMIVPTASTIQNIAEDIGFTKAKAIKLRLAIEEILVERIENAYENVGDIEIRIVLLPNVMRVIVFDGGIPYDIEKEAKTGISARLILYAADDVTILKTEDTSGLMFDFEYENDFNIVSFLMNKEK